MELPFQRRDDGSVGGSTNTHTLWWLVAALMALALLYSRIHYHCHYLFGWDGIQFALSMEKFDVRIHQPHPPGYLLYCFCLRILNLLFHDPNSTMIALNILSTAGAMIFIARLVLELLPNAHHKNWLAAGAVLLYMTNPVCWLYSSVAEIYAVEGFFAAALIYFMVLSFRKPRILILVSVLMAIAGGFRPSTEAFLFPAYALCFLKKDFRTRLFSLGLLLAVNVIWLGILVSLSGGIHTYFGLISTQAHSPVTAGALPPSRVLILMLQAVTIPIFLALLFRCVRLRVKFNWTPLIAAIAFPCLTFTLVYFGKDGYMMLVLPTLIVLAVLCLGVLYPQRWFIALIFVVSGYWNFMMFVHPSYYSAEPSKLSGTQEFINDLNSVNKRVIFYRENLLRKLFFNIGTLRPGEVFILLEKPDGFPDWRTTMYYFPEDTVAVILPSQRSAEIAKHHESQVFRREVSLGNSKAFVFSGNSALPFPTGTLDILGNQLRVAPTMGLPARFEIARLKFDVSRQDYRRAEDSAKEGQ
jgi:Protein O-mannosyl-transferase TMEM260-like